MSTRRTWRASKPTGRRSRSSLPGPPARIGWKSAPAVELDGDSVAALVQRTGEPARLHGYEHLSGPPAALARQLGVVWSVGAPIVVDQRLWGVMMASSRTTGRWRRTASRESPPSRSSPPPA